MEGPQPGEHAGEVEGQTLIADPTPRPAVCFAERTAPGDHVFERASGGQTREYPLGGHGGYVQLGVSPCQAVEVDQPQTVRSLEELGVVVITMDQARAIIIQRLEAGVELLESTSYKKQNPRGTLSYQCNAHHC